MICTCEGWELNFILFFFTEKPFASTKKLNLPKKEDGRQKRSKSRTSKSEKPSKSDGVFSEASQSACKSQCLLYGKADNKLDSENVTAIGGRDTALFLFRALGKILYCKSKFFQTFSSHHFGINNLATPYTIRSVSWKFLINFIYKHFLETRAKSTIHKPIRATGTQVTAL